MKPKLYPLTAFASLILSAAAAETAKVRMYCLSLEADQAQNQYGDNISFNFAGRPDSINEFGPWWPGGNGSYNDIHFPDVDLHGSYLYLYDSYQQTVWSGAITVTVPLIDVNNNRFPDFFEVARSVNYTLTSNPGNYYLYAGWGFDSGVISYASWTRAAGTNRGNYVFTFYDTTPGVPTAYWGTFRGVFKIFEYTGTLSYTPGSNVVSGSIHLVQTGVPTNTLDGPISFLKNNFAPCNSLTNQHAVWADSNSLHTNVMSHYYIRDPNYPTNYAGYIEFDDDNDSSTVYPYGYWTLSITDTNDADHDGIPDFSDEPIPPPRQPLVSLTPTATNLLLTIHGDINHVHTIEQVPALSSTSWQDVTSITLTNDPQVVPVSLPTGSVFFRVKAQ